jgi:hypothetical protein
MEVVLCTGHGYVEQASFLLNFGRGAGPEIGGHAAIDDIEQIDRLPLLALGRMNCGQDQVILIEQRHAGLVAGGGSA